MLPSPPIAEPYRIDLGDALNVDFFYHPELSRQQVVRPDGRITLPGVGDLEAVGKTPTDLSAEISRAFEGLLKDPLVTVAVTQMAAARVYVVGEVLRPGGYPMQGRWTLSSAISEAGGFTKRAKLDAVAVYRRSGSSPNSFQVDAGPLEGGAALNPEVYLFPNDIVFVPRTSVGRLTDTLGLLNQPGLYYLLLLVVR